MRQTFRSRMDSKLNNKTNNTVQFTKEDLIINPNKMKKRMMVSERVSIWERREIARRKLTGFKQH